MNRCHDLHTHTTASDGTLTPAELLLRAEVVGVEYLAITDHDTVAGVLQAQAQPSARVQLIPGIELSALWGKRNIHVVGLNMDPLAVPLQALIERQLQARQQRGIAIHERLLKLGLPPLLERARVHAGPAELGRPHFARAMLEAGVVSRWDDAFDRYLGEGKPAAVVTAWCSVAEAIAVIQASGGVAVLAHPLYYRLTWTKLRELLDHWVECGGDGVELLSGRQNPQDTAYLGRLLQQRGLAASVGSDFHSPGVAGRELGGGRVPDELTPIWDRW